MQRYRYRAYDAAGSLQTGEMESSSEIAVLERLRLAGLYPVDAQPCSEDGRIPWWSRDLFAQAQLPARSLALLTRELATLVDAGIPLDEALRIVSLHPMGARLRKVVDETLTRLLEGNSLSEAMERQGSFGGFYCSMVRAGEAGANLPEALRQLATHLERSIELTERLRSALVYPLVLMAMGFGALILIATVLLPTIAPIFAEAGAEPPFVIRVMLAIESVLSDYWLLIAIFGLMTGAGVIALIRQQGLRLAMDRALLRLPLVGDIVRMAQTAAVARTLASLLSSGVPMMTALQVTQETARNSAVATALRSAAESVGEGGTLSEGLLGSSVFPDLMLRLVAVGEETGRLDSMLLHVENIFESQLRRRLDHLMTLLTPALTIIMGVFVGGLILSVMSAIFSVNELALQ